MASIECENPQHGRRFMTVANVYIETLPHGQQIQLIDYVCEACYKELDNRPY